MNDEAIAFYAKKYFPWLLPKHGENLIKELWEMHLKRNQVDSVAMSEGAVAASGVETA